jgi:aspartate/tyrosine/aromatic aminotransferase
MADRIIDMRDKLYNALIELKTPGSWDHIKSQIGELLTSVRRNELTYATGMFSFTGREPFLCT